MKAYRIPNDEVLAFNMSGGRPRCRRPRLDELGRLTFQFRVFLDTLDSDLQERAMSGGKHIRMELTSHHRLLEADKSSNHEQQISGDCCSERQSETGKSHVHVRENCDEGDTPDGEAGENIETRRDPPVYCAAVCYGSSY